MAYIEMRNVNKVYGSKEVEVKALNNASFTIEKGELVVILGPSGAGKTTCLNILGGMDQATDGEVLIDGTDITIYGKTGMGKANGIVVDAWFTGFAESTTGKIYFCVRLGRSDGMNVSSQLAKEIATKVVSNYYIQ